MTLTIGRNETSAHFVWRDVILRQRRANKAAAAAVAERRLNDALKTARRIAGYFQGARAGRVRALNERSTEAEAKARAAYEAELERLRRDGAVAEDRWRVANARAALCASRHAVEVRGPILSDTLAAEFALEHLTRAAVTP